MKLTSLKQKYSDLEKDRPVGVDAARVGTDMTMID
jgi:hypothetical protein